MADRQLFAVVIADPGCGKSTLIRMFESRFPKDKYMLLYLSDSKLTPRWLYAGLLDHMGLEARFYQGDSKRQLQKEIETVRTVQKKKVVFVLDEAHLLGKEILEEFRFLLNYRFDSASPMSLILVGQIELWYFVPIRYCCQNNPDWLHNRPASVPDTLPAADCTLLPQRFCKTLLYAYNTLSYSYESPLCHYNTPVVAYIYYNLS